MFAEKAKVRKPHQHTGSDKRGLVVTLVGFYETKSSPRCVSTNTNSSPATVVSGGVTVGR